MANPLYYNVDTIMAIRQSILSIRGLYRYNLIDSLFKPLITF